MIYSVAFLFEAGQQDAEFERLNALIDAAASATPGFLGAESWSSRSGTMGNATYYWDSLEALKAFSTHPQHQTAKRQYARWYRGYHVIVSEVIRSYGDGNLPHITPNQRQRSE